VQSMAGRFVEGLEEVGDSLYKISTNCMKYGYVVFLLHVHVMILPYM
jgi:hypothetical protein